MYNSPEEYIHAIKNALETGGYHIAEKLSAEAVKPFP